MQEVKERNRCESVEEVPTWPQEKIPVESDTEDEDILERRDEVPLRVRIPGARGRSGPPADEVHAAINSRMWLKMVNVNPPHLADLEGESIKKFILDYKRYSHKCPRQFLRRMQNFILKEQLELMCDKDGREYEDIVSNLRKKSLFKSSFISIKLILAGKCENGEIKSILTNVQYVEGLSYGCRPLEMLIGFPRKRS